MLLRKDSNLLIAALENAILDGEASTLEALAHFRPADIAEVARQLTPERALLVFNALGDERAVEVFPDLGLTSTRYLLDQLPVSRIAELLRPMAMDDAAWIVSVTNASRAEEILTTLAVAAPKDAAEIRGLLLYQPFTAGRLLTEHCVRLSPYMTVEGALAAIRQMDSLVETLTDIYVVDDPGRPAKAQTLLGVISLRGLIIAAGERTLGELMTTDLVTVNVDTDQEEVARLISKYDFLAMPVLDRQGKFAGIVTIDDVVDVIVEEGTEDQLRFSGVEPGVINQPYFTTPLWQVARSRAGWLILLFVAETATGSVLRHFEEDLAKVVALSFFVPLLIGTGGNTGAQTVSTIIRGLALGEIQLRDSRRVILREILGGLILGGTLGLIAYLRALLWGSGPQLSLVVGLTILSIVTWANTIGSAIPLVAQRLKIDPALVSAPLITTLVDATGLVIYFSIAKLLLDALA